MTDGTDRGTPENPSADTGKMNVSGHDASARTDRSSIAGADQDAFWRRHFAGRDYTDQDRGYDYYRPAFQYGWESRDRYRERSFEAVEADLQREWDPDRTGLPWEEARPAIRDAFERSATEWSDPGNPLA